LISEAKCSILVQILSTQLKIAPDRESFSLFICADLKFAIGHYKEIGTVLLFFAKYCSPGPNPSVVLGCGLQTASQPYILLYGVLRGAQPNFHPSSELTLN
jgi:hypothetical protein